MGLLTNIKNKVTGLISKVGTVITGTTLAKGVVTGSSKTVVGAAILGTLQLQKGLDKLTSKVTPIKIPLTPIAAVKNVITSVKQVTTQLKGKSKTSSSGILPVSNQDTKSSNTPAVLALTGQTKTDAAQSGGASLSNSLMRTWNNLNPSTKTALKVAGGVVLAGAAAYGVSKLLKKKKKAKKKGSKKKAKKRAKKGSRKRSRGKKHYGTSKQYARKGGKVVHRTKNGQPYIILANGRARFIKR